MNEVLFFAVCLWNRFLKYQLAGQGQWVSRFEIVDSFALRKNNLLTTLEHLPFEWKVEFQFMPSKLDIQDYTSIVHLTARGECCSVGDRIPAVWYHPNHGLHIVSALNGHGDVRKNFAAPPVAIGQWTTIKV